MKKVKKRISLTLVAVFLCTAGALFAQEDIKTKEAADETMVVKVSDLPDDLAEKLKQQKRLESAQQTAETVTAVAKNVKSTGHEVAVAVDEILGALTKHADAFSKTDAGQFTMGMVFLAIMKDQIPEYVSMVVGYVFGIPFVIFMNCSLMFIYFRTTRQIRRIKEIGPDGKKVYEYVDTWFTSMQNRRNKEDKLDTSDREAFTGLFWIFTFVANFLFIWLVIF